jgi:hypothetical protein
MTRKARKRRLQPLPLLPRWRGEIVELLFNEPATRRGAGRRANPKGCAEFGRVLCCSSVKDHRGYARLGSIQANFEQKNVLGGKPFSNGHLDIL